MANSHWGVWPVAWHRGYCSTAAPCVHTVGGEEAKGGKLTFIYISVNTVQICTQMHNRILCFTLLLYTGFITVYSSCAHYTLAGPVHIVTDGDGELVQKMVSTAAD